MTTVSIRGLLGIVCAGALALVGCRNDFPSDTTHTTSGTVQAPSDSHNLASGREVDGGRDGGSVGGNDRWPSGNNGQGTGSAGQPANTAH